MLWLTGKMNFHQSVKNNLRTYENINRIVTYQGDDYTNGYFLDYNYFKSYYKMAAIDLSKLQALDDHPKTIQKITFTGNLDLGG